RRGALALERVAAVRRLDAVLAIDDQQVDVTWRRRQAERARREVAVQRDVIVAAVAPERAERADVEPVPDAERLLPPEHERAAVATLDRERRHVAQVGRGGLADLHAALHESRENGDQAHPR